MIHRSTDSLLFLFLGALLSFALSGCLGAKRLIKRGEMSNAETYCTRLDDAERRDCYQPIAEAYRQQGRPRYAAALLVSQRLAPSAGMVCLQWSLHDRLKTAHGPGHAIGECLKAGVDARVAYRAAMMSLLLVEGDRATASNVAFWLASSNQGGTSVQEMNAALKATAVKMSLTMNLALDNADEMVAALDKLVATARSDKEDKGRQVTAGIEGSLENLRHLIKTSSDNPTDASARKLLLNKLPVVLAAECIYKRAGAPKIAAGYGQISTDIYRLSGGSRKDPCLTTDRQIAARRRQLEALDKTSTPVDQRDDPDLARHDGFFLRLVPTLGTRLGFIDGSGTLEHAGTTWSDPRSFGGGVNLRIEVGAAVIENLIVHFTGSAGGIVSSFDNNAPGDWAPTFLEVFAGAGASYYFMPVNLYLGLSAGWGMLGWHRACSANGCTKEYVRWAHGGGAILTLGKEWWVNNNTGLGVSLTGTVLSTSGGDLSTISGSIAIATSLTFN